jgi:acetyl-CoA carboxylase carboxyltransferase component
MTLAVAAGVPSAATAGLGEVAGVPAARFHLAGGPHIGALGPAEGLPIERTIALAVSTGRPIVGVMATSGADVHEGVASLVAWGRIARALAGASGVVPIVLAVTGPCVSGPALMLGLADHVVMTADAFAYLSGPNAVAEMTGVEIDHATLGGAGIHARRTGLASLVVAHADDVDDAIADLLSFLPRNHLEDPPLVWVDDPVDRPCDRAAATVPESGSAAYDVRDVVTDVVDAATFLEIRAEHAPNMVTGYARIGGRSVGVIANQPRRRAGTLDIDASRKAARLVQSCDAFNVPLITFVDTPGFEPGRDLEWRGMIRHGAELVHAYAEATVPRLAVILRKAFGGAYIVMDSRTLGNDVCVAWPAAQIAVMGPAGAGAILRGIDEHEYTAEFLTPWHAVRRGYVDDVIDPRATRGVLAGALDSLATKRDDRPARKHANTPL